MRGSSSWNLQDSLFSLGYKRNQANIRCSTNVNFVNFWNFRICMNFRRKDTFFIIESAGLGLPQAESYWLTASNIWKWGSIPPFQVGEIDDRSWCYREKNHESLSEDCLSVWIWKSSLLNQLRQTISPTWNDDIEPHFQMFEAVDQ